MPVFFALSLLVFISAGGSEQQEDKSFAWTMALQNIRTEDLLPFSAPVKSSTGERFRLVIRPEADCYCYVIAESTNGEEVAALRAGLLDSGKEWLSPDIVLAPPGGSESIFVVVSRDEQAALVQSIDAYNSGNTPVRRRILMNEVLRIRGEVSRYREIPEKPIVVGGSARGNPGRNEGVEFSGLDTYVKTISIEH